jgi:DNA polymerase-4
VILHADADAFFVSVARLVDPDGAGKARLLIVGGTAGGRGVVCSASYETRAFGVRSAMPVSRALRLCPDAMCVPVPRECAQKSAAIRRVLESWTPAVEAASIDEWYLDMAGTERLYGNESIDRVAHRIRADVRGRTGLGISIGGGPSKFIAKLAAERAKPRVDRPGANGVLIVEQERIAEFMGGLVLADIPGVGPRAQETLRALGLVTVPDALSWPKESLQFHLGTHAGAWLYARVRGQDDHSAVRTRRRKQLSHERTFSQDINDTAELRRRLDALAELVASDLRSEGLEASRVTVKLRDADFSTRTASRTLRAPIASDRAVARVARELFDELRRSRERPARLLGIAVGSFGGDDGDQLGLFETSDAGGESERDRRLSRAVDNVRRRFGARAIHLGSTEDRP